MGAHVVLLVDTPMDTPLQVNSPELGCGVQCDNDHKAAALDATPIACLGVRQSEHAFGIKN